MPRMLKLKDAAAETGLTYSCLRRWILAGEFKDYVKAGNRIYVNMERLVDYLSLLKPQIFLKSIFIAYGTQMPPC